MSSIFAITAQDIIDVLNKKNKEATKNPLKRYSFRTGKPHITKTAAELSRINARLNG